MRKTFTLQLMVAALFCLCSVSASKAQKVYQLPNPGFEEWEVGIKLDGKNATGSTQEPVGWNSFRTGQRLSSLSTNPATKGTEEVDGATNTFASIKAKKIISVIANGNMSTGIITAGNMTPADSSNYNMTVISDQVGASNFRQQFNGKPDALKVRLQYIPVTSTDADVAQVSVWIHTNDWFRDPGEPAASVLAKAVARALINPNATEARDGWKEFIVPFDYSVGNEGNIPAYILASATTNKTQGGGAEGDELKVDDMYMVYYSSLTDIKVSGTTIAGFSEETHTYNFAGEAPNVSDVAYTQKSKWSDASISSSTEGNVTTISISVKGNDYEVSGNETVYKLVYTTAANENPLAGIYTGVLDIDLGGMGGAVLTSPDQVLIKGEGTDKIGLELKNFAFGEMELGDINIPNIPVTVNEGKAEFTSDKITLYLAGGIIEAEVQAIGTIENGVSDITINVEWGGITIPVAFKGDAVVDDLRLSNILVNGVSVAEGTFDQDVFNYGALAVGINDELTFTKANEADKVDVLMDNNWIYLYVTDGVKKNRYALANAADPSQGTPNPITGIRFGDRVDGNLTLMNGVEVNNPLEGVAENTIYHKIVNDANDWIPVGTQYYPSSVKIVKTDGTTSDLNAHLYTYETVAGEFKQKELTALDGAMMVKLKSTADVEALEVIVPAFYSTPMSPPLINGYCVRATKYLMTEAIGNQGLEFTDSYTFYKFDGTEFVQVPSSTDIAPMTMFITYAGSTPAATIAAPDLTVSIDGNMKDNQNVYAADGTVYVNSYTGNVQAYTINGGLAYSGSINNSGSFNLPSGTYIVQTGEKATIIIVK